MTLVIGLAGLAVNAVGATILWRSSSQSLNVRAALYHVVADLLGSLRRGDRRRPGADRRLGARRPGHRDRDRRASCWAAPGACLRESVGVLLEGTPAGIDARGVGRRMAALPGVREVHDLHVWTITSGFPALSAHVLVGPDEDCHARRRELSRMLDAEFGLHAHDPPGGAHRSHRAPAPGVRPRPQPARRLVRYMTTMPARKPPTTQPEPSPPGARRAR